MVATQVAADADGGIRKGDWIVAVSPVRLADGSRLMWHPPQPVTFNLLEAKRNRDPAVRKRLNIMGNLVVRPSSGELQPANTHAALDCLSGLSPQCCSRSQPSRVWLITRSRCCPTTPCHASQRPRASKGRTDGWPRHRREAEASRALARSRRDLAGTGAWERYLELKFLRDELLHVKARGYDPDPDVTTAYDRLMLGEGDRCVEDAKAVVESALPGFLPEEVLEALV